MEYANTATSGSFFSYRNLGINSLRVRQMLSMLVLVAIGVSLLGGGYLSMHNSRLMNEMMLEQQAVASQLLVTVPAFNDEAIVTEADKNELLQLLSQHKFSEGFADDGSKREYYAYLENPETGVVRWQSKFPLEAKASGNNVASKQLIKPFNITDDKLDKPTLKERLLTSYSEEEATKQVLGFMVYSQNLRVQGQEPARLVIAKSAIDFTNDWDHVQKNIIALFFSTLALVLISQLISNYFIITPIRDFESEVKKIEAGAQKAIEKAYPVELMEVKSAINTLINVEKGQKKRYRESLDNLAHSLKTPLAGLLANAQTNYDMKKDDHSDLVNEINHMCEIVAYQLKRAAVRAPNAMVEQQQLRPILYRLKGSLEKVYHQKTFDININVDELDKVRLESDDLIELFGNLMNNACRFCDTVVEVSATSETNFLIVDIDDDGMGFGVDTPSELLKRGMRDDSKTEGQGIGMAISNEIVEAAGGRIELKVSPQIGARVRLYLPH
ncbi:two-component sensor histidine kinase [Leucothrix sargassi]|nr:two-component sensor histidine kinase [Leucothrix sargassi]